MMMSLSGSLFARQAYRNLPGRRCGVVQRATNAHFRFFFSCLPRSSGSQDRRVVLVRESGKMEIGKAALARRVSDLRFVDALLRYIHVTSYVMVSVYIPF
jgi:hypothetical protein